MNAMRSKPCPCGSGKPYKKCCGSVSRLTAKKRTRRKGKHKADLNNAAILLQQGRIDEARNILLSIAQSDPGNDSALVMLAGIAHQTGQLQEAVALVNQAITINPAVPAYHVNLGGLHKVLNHHDVALDCYGKAVELDPGNLHALLQMAECCTRLERPHEAIAHYRKAASINPDMADIHIAVGSLYITVGKFDEAIESFRQACGLRPASGTASSGLGDALRMKGYFEEAIDFYEGALRNPGSGNPAFIHTNIGVCRQSLGNIPEAISSFREAVQLLPDRHEQHTNLLMALNYSSLHSPEEVFREHTSFQRAHAREAGKDPATHSNSRDPDRRIRVGYVSSNFYEHSVAHFIKPVLDHHDQDRFEMYGYYNNDYSDPMTECLSSGFSRWYRVKSLSDDALSRLIRSDGVDILVDLNGHTADNRLLVFAAKPAPVQITWIGYPNTTGLSAMDYRITDAIADPPGTTEHLHTERLLRLPDTFSCYSPPDPCPGVAEPPVLKNGYITFGSFNNFAKITPPVIEVWCRLLERSPGSRLVLKAELFQEPASRQRIEGLFRQAGIDATRIELVGKDASRTAHLQRYAEIDIALDSFPYSGTTTTCEALWMGVPVITLAGRVHAGRVGVSQMKSIGLDEFVAQTPDQYADIAAALAEKPGYLQTLRSGMRERLAASPLLDAERFTRNLEMVYLDIWRAWFTESDLPGTRT